MPKGRLARVAACVLSIGVSIAAHADTDLDPIEAASLPSITARHVTRHEPSDTELGSKRIELSPAGLRVRGEGEDDAQEMLQDFDSERAWLIDRDRRIVTELPYVEAIDSPEDSGSDDDDGSGRSRGKSEKAGDVELEGAGIPAELDDSGGNVQRVRGGFLGSVPCVDLQMRDDGPATWRGRKVNVFSCFSERGHVVSAVEFIDKVFSVVIYRRDEDGLTNALEDLRARDYGPSHFRPDPELRAVEAHEFFVGAPPIGSFEERPIETR